MRNADEIQMQTLLDLRNFQLFCGNKLACTTVLKICECCLATILLINSIVFLVIKKSHQ